MRRPAWEFAQTAAWAFGLRRFARSLPKAVHPAASRFIDAAVAIKSAHPLRRTAAFVSA